MPIFPDPATPLGRAYAAVDWSTTPLGPVSSWSTTLRSAVNLMLDTRFPVTLLWGPEFALVYNEAYVELIADKHPASLGRPAQEVFPEAWDVIGPMMRSVSENVEPIWVEDAYLPLIRGGFLEERYFTFSYSPVRNSAREVEGVMDIATDTTERVVSERRLQLLSRLAWSLADVERLEDLPRVALPVLRSAAADLPAVDVWVPGFEGEPVEGLPPRPQELSAAEESVERYADGLVARLPLASDDDADPSCLVVRLSPLLAPDEAYLGFLRLVAVSLRQGLDRVRVRVADRRTAEVQHSMSEALQRSLLPQPMGSAGPEVAVRYEAAAELAQIGGDWFDWFDLPDGSLSIVIGDVQGHDVEAAAAMAQVRNITRGVSYSLHPAPPSRVLSGLDRAICGTAGDVSATSVLAHVTRGADRSLAVRWSNAGHPPPVLIEPGGSARLLETAPDLLLGVDEDAVRQDHSLVLAPGATLVLYTDGLVERRGTSILDGMTRLVDALRGRHDMDVEQICDYLLDNVGALEDDVALLVLRA